MTDKPVFNINKGVPSPREIVKMFEVMTGRKATPNDINEIRELYREHNIREHAESFDNEESTNDE